MEIDQGDGQTNRGEKKAGELPKTERNSVRIAPCGQIHECLLRKGMEVLVRLTA